jgi:hypothetical protein
MTVFVSRILLTLADEMLGSGKRVQRAIGRDVAVTHDRLF